MDAKLDSYTPLGPTDKTKDFLRDFFRVLPSGGKKNLVKDVSGCANDENLRQLVQRIRTGLLIPLKAQRGKTPTETTSLAYPILGETIEPLKGPEAELRHHCLERDGNKCLATGNYSHSHAHPKHAFTTYLEPAYVIPFAPGSFQDVDENATIWVILRRYFPALRTMPFTSEQVNSEKNILMLDSMVHMEFGQFRLIFEATGAPNHYRIKPFPGIVTSAIQNLPKSRLVNFRVHKGNWDLPDPRLLHIHACIGKFLHRSGQGKVIDKLLQNFERCGGLAPSGSFNIEELLAARLSLLPSNVKETPDYEAPSYGEGETPTGKTSDTENKSLGTADESDTSENAESLWFFV